MSQPFRLSSGGRIDRSTGLRFQVDGRNYLGHPGDTLASAMLANGVHLAGRSFKYHRPRGIVGAGPEEPNALFGIDRGGGRFDPNTRATQIALFDGLRAVSQNRWPSLTFDVGSLAGAFGRLMPAGFYYKTFMWPGWAWERVYEPAIRAMSGVGRAPNQADPDQYISRYAHCDVLVVGGGPAGLAAALAAAENNARVVLCDEQEELGGHLLSRPQQRIDGRPAWDWLETAVTQLRAMDVRLLPRTTAFAYQAQNFVAMAERRADHMPCPAKGMARQRLWQVRAKQVVLATGAIERPLVFGNNDRPGIMLAGAVQAYVNRYAVLPGRRAVLVANHDSGYRAALEFAAAGGRIVAVVDPRGSADSQSRDELGARGAEILPRHTVTDTRGRTRVNGVCVAPLNEAGSRGRWIDCDLIMMAGGWTPSIHLFSQSGGRPRWDASIDAFVPAAPAQAQHSAGACAGIFSLSATLTDGHAAGVQASIDAGAHRRPTKGAPQAEDPEPSEKGAPPGALPGEQDAGRPMAFVDFQHDVTMSDIKLALAEGFRAIEHVKRYTTTGMATDQGKTSNLNALGIVAKSLHKSIPEVGTTTFRAPYTPVTFGTLAGANRGELFDPIRVTPIHDWAVANRAVFENVGQWKRARYFPLGTEDKHAAVRRECRQTRAAVGMMDASTLGKIEVVGPDAAELLDRLYASPLTSLPVGRCRYSIMLGEDGFIIDDGIVARLAVDRFHVTTTTGGAARVLHVMEDYLQTEFHDLEVWLTSITEQWAVIAVSGPKAREMLSPIVSGIDLTKDAFPHLAVRAGTACDVPARVFRVSFTGELAYELNVPADHGRFVWERVHAAGTPFGIVAYGTEAMHVLRAEKGYIIVGQETDGTVTPRDVGLEWTIGKTKPDFVGKRSLRRPDALAQDRKQLVGLRSKDRRTVLDEGVTLAEHGHGPGSRRLLGHVTSSYWSESTGEPIALALVRNGRTRIGETLIAQMSDRATEVEVVRPVFYDPEGVRVNG
jgi:sarcosine oxidase subunit alpha